MPRGTEGDCFVRGTSISVQFCKAHLYTLYSEREKVIQHLVQSAIYSPLARESSKADRKAWCRLHVSQVQQSGDRLCLRNEATLDTAGIFDMRWMITSSSRPSLAMACSDGKALLIGVQGSDGSDTLPLSKDAEAQCFPDAMATFVGLRRRDACSPCDRISAAGSNGELATLKAGPLTHSRSSKPPLKSCE